jgi:glycosyltransferase involved in cell wall biosynthesis
MKSLIVANSQLALNTHLIVFKNHPVLRQSKSIDILILDQKIDQTLMIDLKEFKYVSIPFLPNLREPYLSNSLSILHFLRYQNYNQVIFNTNSLDAFFSCLAARQGIIESEVYITDRHSDLSGQLGLSSNDHRVDIELALAKNIASRIIERETNESYGLMQTLKGAHASDAPSVTFVVTHFNRSDLIRYTLDSIRAVDYPNFEIIVVDDQSDESHFLRLQQYCQECIDFPISLKKTPHNMGLGGARNSALQWTESEYVVYVDDDDIVHPQILQFLIKAAVSMSCEVVVAAMNYKKFEGKETDFDITMGKNIVYFNQQNLSHAMLKNCLGGATALISVDCLKRVGGYHEYRGIGLDDWWLYAVMIMKKVNMTFVPFPLLWYRDVSQSMSKKINRAKGMRMLANELDNFTNTDYHQTIRKQHHVITKLTKQVKFHNQLDLVGLNQKLLSQDIIYIYGAGDVGDFIYEHIGVKNREKVRGFIDVDIQSNKKKLALYTNIDRISEPRFSVIVATIASQIEVQNIILDYMSKSKQKITLINPLNVALAN